MEDEILDILSRYISRQAAANLLERAKAAEAPRGPQAWARLLEGPLWAELTRLLPFREMPPELKALLRRLKEAPAPPAPAEEAPEEEAWVPVRGVDLEDPQAREALAQELARLEEVRGVVVAGRSGRAERLREEAPLLDSAHLLLRGQGYESFYLLLERGFWVLRNLNGGYIGLMASKEANIGRLLYQLRQLVAKEAG